MSQLRPDMREAREYQRIRHRAQQVSLDCAFTPSSSWPAALVDQVATLLASALVKDLQEHPIGELPAGELLS